MWMKREKTENEIERYRQALNVGKERVPEKKDGEHF